jgi:hypothetical protein
MQIDMGTDPPFEHDDNIVTETGQIRMMGGKFL